MVWLSIGYSVLYVVSLWWVRMLLLLIAVGVTIHIYKLNTLLEEKGTEQAPDDAL